MNNFYLMKEKEEEKKRNAALKCRIKEMHKNCATVLFAWEINYYVPFERLCTCSQFIACGNN